MNIPSKFPIIVKKGNSLVKIYLNSSRGYPGFRLAYYSEGKRTMERFNDYHKAIARASEINTSINNGEILSKTISGTQRLLCLQALSLLEPTNVAINVAAERYRHAHDKLNGRSLSEAVDFFMKHHPSNIKPKPIQEVVDEFIASRKAKGLGKVYMESLKTRLGAFGKDFQMNIGDVTSQMINAYLEGLDRSQKTKNNHRNSILTMLKFARANLYASREGFPLEEITWIKQDPFEIEIFTPKEMRKLLETVVDQKPLMDLKHFTIRKGSYNKGFHVILPMLLLGGFAGMRTAEVLRQKWSDIYLDRGFIRVTAAKGNTAQKRMIPISENLKQWLLITPRGGEMCCPVVRPHERTARLAEAAGIKWKNNALRHSYISYRVAITKNIPQTSLEAGNSVDIVNRHYRELVAEDEAKEWFNIFPEEKAP